MNLAALAPPFVAARIDVAGIAFLVVMGLYLPWKAWGSRKLLAGGPILPPLDQHYLGVIITQLVLLMLALATALASHIRLFPRVAPTAGQWLLGAAVLGAMLATAWPRWRGAVRKGDRRLYFFMPRTGREKVRWIGVSFAAGIGEEIVYRGVAFALFYTLTRDVWIAALLAALIFAAGHAFQSARSMAIIFMFSLAFQALAVVSGALYVGMAVHVAYDVAAGLAYSRLGREMGYQPDAVPPPPPDSQPPDSQPATAAEPPVA